MMTGENPYITKDLSKWIAETTNSNFVNVESDIFNEKMQENLLQQLQKAEENYQSTNKRTVIYVEGMDKLLTKKENSVKNIAMMKNIMQKADRAYHSTIVFHSTEPSKLDPGVKTSNRVGFTLNIPISIQEANMIDTTDDWRKY